jgi:hypothetical protein
MRPLLQVPRDSAVPAALHPVVDPDVSLSQVEASRAIRANASCPLAALPPRGADGTRHAWRLRAR